MRAPRSARFVAVALFATLGWVVAAIALRRIATWPGPGGVEVAWWAVGALLAVAAAVGAVGSWRSRSGLVLGALAAMGAAWAVHAVWRLVSVPPELRAITFGGDVVQSCLALLLFSNVVLWVTGTVELRLPALTARGPPAR